MHLNEQTQRELESDLARRQFDLASQMPLAWRYSARQLKRVADLTFAVANQASEQSMQAFVEQVRSGVTQESRTLSPEEAQIEYDSGLFEVYFLLVGFALENLAKGILVARDPTQVSGGKLKGLIKSHNLIALINPCGTSCDDADREILGRLNRSVSWRGRYPIPVEWSHLTAQNRTWTANIQETKRRIDRLFDDLWVLSFAESSLQEARRQAMAIHRGRTGSRDETAP
jgi:hypothetical protein